MCGRFHKKVTLKDFAEALGMETLPLLPPRYNITPSQKVLCVRTDPASPDKDYEYVQLKWGLVPSWAKDPSIGNKLSNARGETVTEKPSFRKAFQQQRCLILADGYYEWKRNGTTKLPHYVRFKDGRAFAMAGLWERWTKGGGEPLETCAIITIWPNATVEPVHHRMPVIIQEREYHTWLSSAQQNVMYMNGALKPYEPAEEMEAYSVSFMVNNPKNDCPECIRRLN